jgi:hypothetical protein
MRNRAKCKKCESIIESFHRHDYVKCTCGSIAVDGGQDYFKCVADDWVNFIRIDDNDKEIMPTIKDKIEEAKTPSDTALADDISTIENPSDEDRIKADLEALIKVYEELPGHALDQPVTHRDYLSLLGLISTILKLS